MSTANKLANHYNAMIQIDELVTQNKSLLEEIESLNDTLLGTWGMTMDQTDIDRAKKVNKIIAMAHEELDHLFF